MGSESRERCLGVSYGQATIARQRLNNRVLTIGRGECDGTVEWLSVLVAVGPGANNAGQNFDKRLHLGPRYAI